jgi:hypothetical protein
MIPTRGLTHLALEARDVERAFRFYAGEPCLFFADPDGYEVEVWLERPPPVDPAGALG